MSLPGIILLFGISCQLGSGESISPLVSRSLGPSGLTSGFAGLGPVSVMLFLLGAWRFRSCSPWGLGCGLGFVPGDLLPLGPLLEMGCLGGAVMVDRAFFHLEKQWLGGPA
jgi:hypothetical protein